MKTSMKTNLLIYVMIRVLLSTTIACLVMIGAYFITSDTIVMLLIGIPVTMATCLYTAIIIARRTKDLIDEPLTKVIKFANILREASHALIETAESLNQKADIIQTASDEQDNISDLQSSETKS